MVWGLVSGIRWSDRSDEAFVVTAGCDASGDRGHRLPASPRAPSGPMSPEDPTNDPWLRRVQAMLAKAESTQFPAEAEALLAKAQELMSRHAIDEAMLQSAGRAASDAVTTTVVVTTAPYAGAKASLPPPPGPRWPHAPRRAHHRSRSATSASYALQGRVHPVPSRGRGPARQGPGADVPPRHRRGDVAVGWASSLRRGHHHRRRHHRALCGSEGLPPRRHRRGQPLPGDHADGRWG